MYDKIFSDFKLTCKASDEIVKKYEGALPSELLDVWKEYGFGTILDGYLKIVNPDEYREILDMAYDGEEVAIPVFVTAFGDVFVVEEGEYIIVVKIKNGTIEGIPCGFEFFWGDLEDGYKKAVAKLGELGFDECFGYTPLLGLGGKEKIENLEKVNIKSYIELITQMVGRIE